MTLADWLIRRFPTAKRETLRRMVADGRVRVNGRRADRYNAPISGDDRVELDERSEAKRAPVRPAFEIIFEDDDLLVVNKPAGLLTSTVPREPRPTLLAKVQDYVAATSPRSRVGLIHRLDRDASGLLVFSKTDPAYQSLKTQFFHHHVQRVYHAVVHGRPQPPRGRIETRLIERVDGSVHSTRQVGKGEVAITHYEVVQTVAKRSLVRVTLETGRKHQIRVHLGEAGHPIVGDRVYGPVSDGDEKHGLHLLSTRLGLTHPKTNKEMVFEIPLPAHFGATAPMGDC